MLFATNDWFNKGFDTVDLKDAMALLKELKWGTAAGMARVRFGSIFPLIADADSGALNPEINRFGIQVG